jgi:carbamoyl-phosphate synthase large subunit
MRSTEKRWHGAQLSAYYKAMDAAKQRLPLEGCPDLAPGDRPGALEAARRFAVSVSPAPRCARHLSERVESQPILKMHEGRPNIADAIKNRELQIVVNTPAGKLSVTDDSYIRKAAIKHKVPYIATTAAAIAAAKGIAATREGRGAVKSLQEYHADIAEKV